MKKLETSNSEDTRSRHQHSGSEQVREALEPFAWVVELASSPTSEPEYLSFDGRMKAMEWHGRFTWEKQPYHAIRFSRQQDAHHVVVALIDLSELLPHGHTLRGLRAGDHAPRICEHQWDDHKSAPVCASLSIREALLLARDQLDNYDGGGMDRDEWKSNIAFVIEKIDAALSKARHSRTDDRMEGE